MKDFLKKHGLAVVIIVILTLVALWLYHSKDNVINEFATAKETNAVLIKSYRDKDSTLHEIYKANQYSQDFLKQSKDSEIVALRQEFGNQLKNFESRLTLQLTTQGQVSGRVRDTLVVNHLGVAQKLKTFTYDDKWMSLQGFLAADTFSLRYNLTNDLKVDYTWNKPSLFKRKELQINITSNNPNTTIDKVKSITVKEDKLWYEHKGLWFLLGLAGGIYISK